MSYYAVCVTFRGLRTHFSWVANDPKDCDDSCWFPTPLVCLLEKHRNSLEELELEQLGTWSGDTVKVGGLLLLAIQITHHEQ